MKKVTRLLGLLLVAAVLTTVAMTGCGSKEEEATGIQNTTVLPEAEETQEKTAESSLPEAKLIWYTMLPQQEKQDKIFQKANEYIKEKINAEVDIRAIDPGNYEQKMKVIINAGDPFDMLWIADWSIGYANTALNGDLYPLDDLLEKYAPGTKAFIADKFWDLCRVDGKIYGVPNYQIMVRVSAWWFRKDLADKYGVDISGLKDYKDMEKFLSAVKEGEKDITPIAANRAVLYSFGPDFTPENDEPFKDISIELCVMNNNPKKVVSRVLDEGHSDIVLSKMRTAREWYNKGYVRKDLFSISDLDPEIKAGKFACGTMGTYKPGAEAEFKDRYGFDIYAICVDDPVLTGVTSTMQAISATSENPERAMMVIELLNTDAYLFNLLAHGIEGEQYQKVGENRIARIENNGYKHGFDWVLGNTTLGYLIPGKEDNNHEQVKKLNDEASPALLADFNFDKEKVKNEVAACEAMWKEMGEALWAGVLDTEKDFVVYQEKLRKNGIEEIRKEAQKQLDEYWAGK